MGGQRFARAGERRLRPLQFFGEASVFREKLRSLILERIRGTLFVGEHVALRHGEALYECLNRLAHGEKRRDERVRRSRILLHLHFNLARERSEVFARDLHIRFLRDLLLMFLGDRERPLYPTNGARERRTLAAYAFNITFNLAHQRVAFCTLGICRRTLFYVL